MRYLDRVTAAPSPTERHSESHFTAAGSCVLGGLVPLAPYMFTSTAKAALVPSVVVTLLALIAFGFVKGHFTGTVPWRSALQTAVIGGLAAGAAFGIARAIS